MCIGGTPYVCSHIILLSTPTIAGVGKEYLTVLSLNWGGSSLPYGEGQHRRPRREDFAEDVHLCSINCYVIMRTYCCRELFLFDSAIPQRIIGQARYYRLLVLLDKIINIIVR